MSMKRLATMSAIGSHSLNSNSNSNNNNNSNNNSSITYYTTEKGGHHQGLQTMRPSANLHGNVNIMLGGAMLSVVITVVCFVCYCCHRNIKKRSTSSTYRQRWLENDPNMEIYSVEQCYDTSALFMDSQEIISSTQLAQTQIPTLQGPGHGPPPSYEQVVAYDELAARQYHQQYKQFQINNYCPFAPISSQSALLSPTLNTQQQSSSSSFNLENMDTNDNDNYSLKCDTNDENDNEMIYLNNNNIIISDSENNILNMCRYCGKYTLTHIYLNNTNNDNSINNNNININNYIDKCRCTNITSNIENHLNNNDLEIIDSNQNFPSTSTSSSSTSSNNNQQQLLITTNDDNNNNNNNIDDENSLNNENNNKIDFDNLNENGLIRLDMSQIIDNTGLPTYEAALKLESSGYV